MRYLALIVGLLAFPVETHSGALDVEERDEEIEIRNEHYTVIISICQGGMLALLKSLDGKAQFLTNHRIYTDFGVYSQRGHVGTINEAKADVTVKRKGDAVIVSSKGTFCGEPAEGQQPTAYQATYTFNQSPSISVECEVIPPAGQEEIRAFLATCFQIPNLREWAVNTIDGVIREDVQEGGGRSYQARNVWVNTAAPQVGLINSDDTSLLVADIRCDAPTPLQNIIIHGTTLFFAWLDGMPTRVISAPHRIRFTLTISQGDPMR